MCWQPAASQRQAPSASQSVSQLQLIPSGFTSTSPCWPHSAANHHPLGLTSQEQPAPHFHGPTAASKFNPAQ